jgi:hypothetical protein
MLKYYHESSLYGLSMPINEMKENLIKQLKKFAMEDGIETQEETILIDNVIYNFDKFKDMLEQALEDNKITYKEKVDLLNIIHKIDHDAHITAEADGIVSEDEMRLLYHVCFQVGIYKNYIDKLSGNNSM